MSRVDVGGNRAGTQTGYTAYGYNGQVRVLVEGINTTEGTGGAGFYFDYGSFEEVFLGTAGQGAEMPNPGVQSQFLGKSGGNNFQGEILSRLREQRHAGVEPGGEHPEKWVYDPVANPGGIRLGSNEIEGYRDFNINVGGPIKKDKVWWVLLVSQSVERGRAAELPVRQDVRYTNCGTSRGRAPTRSTRTTS